MYCRQCGHIIEVAGRFCGNCGAAIPEEDLKQIEAAEAAKKTAPDAHAHDDAAPSDDAARKASSGLEWTGADAEKAAAGAGVNESPWSVDKHAPTLSFGDVPDVNGFDIPEDPRPEASKGAGFEEPVPERPEPPREEAEGASDDASKRPPQYNRPEGGQRRWQTHDPNGPRRPTSYLVPNIVASILCCPMNLLGIVGIVFSILANNRYDQGNYQEAKNFALVGMILFWVTIGLGLLVWTGFAVLRGVAGYGGLRPWYLY